MLYDIRKNEMVSEIERRTNSVRGDLQYARYDVVRKLYKEVCYATVDPKQRRVRTTQAGTEAETG